MIITYNKIIGYKINKNHLNHKDWVINIIINSLIIKNKSIKKENP
jgi:hypothetical protein